MVNDDAQLFTMEGFAAAIVMVVTAYLVMGTTSVYTPGDTHITDMQLEQLGSDALKMMDTPAAFGGQSELVACVNTTAAGDRFSYNYSRYLRNTALGPADSQVQFTAEVFFRNSTGIYSYHLADSGGSFTGRDPAVRVTRYAGANWAIIPPSGRPFGVESRYQVVLVEVMLWRG